MKPIEVRWPQGPLQWLYLTAGPALFALGFLPVWGVPLQTALGIATLFWVVVWWVSGVVPTEVTALVPIMVGIGTPVAPAGEIVSVYSHRLVFLIVGSIMIAAGWKYWGLAKRISLGVLSTVGTSVSAQVLAWFLLSAFFSALTADTIVAATLIPVALSLTRELGLGREKGEAGFQATTAILLAVAWGSSVGSILVPTGDGLNLIIYAAAQEAAGGDFGFVDWVIAMVPYFVILVPVTGLYIMKFVDVGEPNLEGTRRAYRQELRAMGRVNRGEWLTGLAFVIALALIFAGPLYEEALPWYDPIYSFLLFAFLLMFVPARRSENDPAEPVLSFKNVAPFPVSLLLIWTGAIALARLLEASGVADLIGRFLAPFAAEGGPLVVAVLLGVGSVLTNISTNTGTAALLAPVVVEVFSGAGMNPLPMLLAVAPAVNLSFSVPSGNGCLAVAAGAGVSPRIMFKHGVRLAALTYLVTLGITYALPYVPGWPY